MQVLILSHNAMGGTSNMGKTLQAWFSAFAPEELAQFYIYPEDVPADSRCRNVYRFTDWDNLGLHPRKQTSQAVYQYGRRRTGGVYLLRNWLWKLGRWNRKDLWDWIDGFSPDLVFLASGDYGFLYDIARIIAHRREIPLALCCMDDYYLYNRNAGSLLGHLAHRQLMDSVCKTMIQAGQAFVLCRNMQEDYEREFGIPCLVLHTPAPRWAASGEGEQITYLGNLGFGRQLQLVQIGRALQKCGLPELHVYSAEQNPEILKPLTRENGICFHGPVPGAAVPRIMAQSRLLIHTEFFDPAYENMVRYSVSTKIPESLQNGPCLLAYGPRGIASVDYLAENQAAFGIHRPEDLEEGLCRILRDAALRRQIVANARALARKNHTNTPEMLRMELEKRLKP